jgi:predicted nucleic acid-binding protein
VAPTFAAAAAPEAQDRTALPGSSTFPRSRPLAGPPLLLDTCVYLDVLQGRSPEALDRLLQARLNHHSVVCLAELSHDFGRLDPAHPGIRAVLLQLSATIDDVPAHRVMTPDAETWGMAGILAGMLFRLGGFQAGLVLVTRNLREFDLLDQLLPGGRPLFYRTLRSGPSAQGG